MLIRHLTYFIALAREQHFARAAEACNVTQPTLTAAIKKLEEDLGVRLVIRDHRFVRLTEEGEKLLVWGRQILVDYDSLKDDLAGLRRGLVGTLHLGVIPAAMSAVSFLTSRFAAAHPAAHVEIRSMTSRAIERALEAFEIDAGVTYLENEPLRARAEGAALSRALRVRRSARSPGDGEGHDHVEGSGSATPMPAQRGHAEPPHHQQGRRIDRCRHQSGRRQQLVPRHSVAPSSRRVGEHRSAHLCSAVFRRRGPRRPST